MCDTLIGDIPGLKRFSSLCLVCPVPQDLMLSASRGIYCKSVACIVNDDIITWKHMPG